MVSALNLFNLLTSQLRGFSCTRAAEKGPGRSELQEICELGETHSRRFYLHATFFWEEVCNFHWIS